MGPITQGLAIDIQNGLNATVPSQAGKRYCSSWRQIARKTQLTETLAGNRTW